MSDVDRAIHGIASAQHGAFSRSQARAAGVTRQMLATRLRRGDLLQLSHDVFVVSGAPDTDRRAAVAATLSVNPSALSHGSAAAFWSLPGFRLRPLEIISTRPQRASSPSALARVHTTTCLPARHLTRADGLLVTVPVRVLFDLAGTIHPGRLERLLDAAWRLRLVTGRLLRRTLADLAEHGRPGIQVMRELIDERGDDYRPTESNAEGRFQELMRKAGIHSFERQVDVGACDWLGRVDFRDREVPLVVEIDSETFHASLTDQMHDHQRRDALRAAGYEVMVIASYDLWHCPREVQARVLAAREALRHRP